MTLRTLTLSLFALSLTAADKWTPDDILLMERVTGTRLSKDGRHLAYVKARMDKEKGETISNLWLKNLTGNYDVEVTRGTDNNAGPQFSPDSKKLAFLSSRKPADAKPDSKTDAPGGMQVWIYDLHGGEPYKVTSFEKGVRGFHWLDSETFLLIAQEDDTLANQKVKDRKDTSMVVEDEKNAAPARLFRYEIKGNKATRLTSNTDRITSMSVSPDSAWAVTIHDRSLSYIYNQKVKPAAFLVNLKTNQSTRLFADDKLRPQALDWAPDSKSFYFSSPYTTDPQFENAAISLLYNYDVASAQAAPVALDWERGLAFGGLAAQADGVAVMLLNGARSKPARYTRNGAAWTRAWIEGEAIGEIAGFQMPEGSRNFLYQTSTASQPPVWRLGQLYGGKVEGSRVVLEPYTSLKKKPLSKSEVISWKGALDEPVEGILYYPQNYQPGRKYPLVVMIHGGPHGHDSDTFNESWAYPHQLYTQRGAFILKPNYHGSSGYGLKWGESISGGKYNDLEWVDVEKGVDSLIAKGLVDPNMLGVLGWSNGSIITIELTTRTTRYKAAGAGAGDVNYISDWGNAVFGHAFDAYYLGKTPLDDPAFYVKKSPLFRMDKVKTPTIIFFGTEDKQVPTEQGWQHYRALQHYGQTDVRFILFPGEAHSPRKYVHQKRKLDEELAWFDKYLFGVAKDENEALKADSPLSAALLLKKSADVPGTVERGEIAIGRFEVTRGQFAAFDPGYKFPAGTENYPATGVTYAQAKGYCEWLSKKTGQSYRLGTVEEMTPHLKASKTENVLDAWAGYPVNPDDALKLASLVEGLGSGALLKPAGSSPGSGDDPIYDLGGNAAEWVVNKDGSGTVLGGSADRPADAKSPSTTRPDYIGFRVVRPLENPPRQ
jgi:dipeptidyl aminopeptidase/acylaminoacyl peptidase